MRLTCYMVAIVVGMSICARAGADTVGFSPGGDAAVGGQFGSGAGTDGAAVDNPVLDDAGTIDDRISVPPIAPPVEDPVFAPPVVPPVDPAPDDREDVIGDIIGDDDVVGDPTRDAGLPDLIGTGEVPPSGPVTGSTWIISIIIVRSSVRRSPGQSHSRGRHFLSPLRVLRERVRVRVP